MTSPYCKFRPSQDDQVMDALLAGETITPMDALRRFGCFRLGARIHGLRRAGVPIDTQLIYEGRKHWASYTLGKVNYG